MYTKYKLRIHIYIGVDRCRNIHTKKSRTPMSNAYVCFPREGDGEEEGEGGMKCAPDTDSRCQ